MILELLVKVREDDAAVDRSRLVHTISSTWKLDIIPRLMDTAAVCNRGRFIKYFYDHYPVLVLQRSTLTPPQCTLN